MSEDDSWVFDSLVCFLNGPIWNAPLQSFIEERSLIFEPQEPDSDEEHKKIYDDFKNLVDFMLGNFMEDIGISPEQFESACFRGAKEGVPMHFDQNTFEQIWAANDYEMFKRMMTQRNVELQLQALELIERKFGKTPESFIPQKRERIDNNTAQVAPILIKSSELEREVLVEVSKQFPIEEVAVEEEAQQEEEKYLTEEKHNLEETLKVAIEEKLSSQKHFLEQKPEEEQPDDDDSVVSREEKPRKVSIATRIPIDRPQNSNADNVEIKKRQEYLRTQRDKLVAMKKEVRKKHLDEDKASSVEKARVRPKSSRAAESILKFGAAPSLAESERIKLRKVLVDRLKAEVINQPE